MARVISQLVRVCIDKVTRSAIVTVAINLALETDFLVRRKLVARGGVSWQRSHGGLRSAEILTEEQYAQYDRLPAQRV
jgi:hypothetical protein